RELALGSPHESASDAKVRRQLALEPCGDLFRARVLEVRSDRRSGPAAERRDQPAFFTRLPQAIAVQIGPDVSPLPDRRIGIDRRAQLGTGVPPVAAIVALEQLLA